MLGFQSVLFFLLFFIVGCESAAPGVSMSTIRASVQLTLSVQERSYDTLCQRVELRGVTCPVSTSPSTSP